MADVTVLVMTDGRPHIFDTLPVALDRLGDQVTDWVIHDDSGDPDYRATLTGFGLPIIGQAQRVGYAHAMRHAWEWLADNGQPYIFHLEDDFLIERRPDVQDMCGLLADRAYLLEVSLLRQPWSPEEVEAGGIVEFAPDAYTDMTDGRRHWLEHKRWFTTNPGVYRRALTRKYRWPVTRNSEWRFSKTIYRIDRRHRGAYWGRRGDPLRVRHVGLERSGIGY